MATRTPIIVDPATGLKRQIQPGDTIDPSFVSGVGSLGPITAVGSSQATDLVLSGNEFSFGPIGIAAGKKVTVALGVRWVVN